MGQAEEEGEKQEAAGCERHQMGAAALTRQVAEVYKTWSALNRPRPPGLCLIKDCAT